MGSGQKRKCISYSQADCKKGEGSYFTLFDHRKTLCSANSKPKFLLNLDQKLSITSVAAASELSGGLRIMS